MGWAMVGGSVWVALEPVGGSGLGVRRPHSSLQQRACAGGRVWLGIIPAFERLVIAPDQVSSYTTALPHYHTKILTYYYSAILKHEIHLRRGPELPVPPVAPQQLHAC